VAVIASLSMLLLMAAAAALFAFGQQAEAQRQAALAEEGRVEAEKQRDVAEKTSEELEATGRRLNAVLAEHVRKMYELRDNLVKTSNTIFDLNNNMNSSREYYILTKLSDSEIIIYLDSQLDFIEGLAAIEDLPAKDLSNLDSHELPLIHLVLSQYVHIAKTAVRYNLHEIILRAQDHFTEICEKLKEFSSVCENHSSR
jgi:hypothetical protein